MGLRLRRLMGHVVRCWAQCLGPTYTGDFHLKGADLRKRGLNRVGNLLVPQQQLLQV